MARFRGTIQGSRGEASRLGDKKSGLRVDANGWHVGGQIIMDAKGDTDYVTFYVTSGSNGRQSKDTFTSPRQDLTKMETISSRSILH